jgi:DNA-binding transcriptional ArsR family regulator
MRPLFHPSIQEVTVEGVLHALADPVRIAIYTALAASDCPHSCSNLLSMAGDGLQAIAKSTLSQHFKVLREAGLIRSVRRGVEMQNTSRCEELQQRFPGLLPAILGAHAAQKKTASKRHRSEREL